MSSKSNNNLVVRPSIEIEDPFRFILASSPTVESSTGTIQFDAALPNNSESESGDAGYGVTPPDDGAMAPDEGSSSLVAKIEHFIESYVSFPESAYSLVIALWLAATHTWATFDAFPYLVVTSSTKRSGKTRLMELMSFVAANARSIAHVSPAALFRTIDTDKPTLFIDEAESFSSPQSEFRPLLNTGYRRGQTVLRQNGSTTVEYETYCPKAFALIGDVYDTLRDRSIIVSMRRGTPQQRFVYAVAQHEGATLRDDLLKLAKSKSANIYEATAAFEGLRFLTDRDEEIWTPLFVLCSILCPNRIEELTRSAVDIATSKTAPAKKFTALANKEKEAEEHEYAERLLLDMVAVVGDRKHLTTAEALPLLRAIPTSPWRKFRGTGLVDGIDGAMDVAALLSQFGISPKTLRVAPKGEKNSTAKGYERKTLIEAAQQAGLVGGNVVTCPGEVPAGLSTEPSPSAPNATDDVQANIPEAIVLPMQAVAPEQLLEPEAVHSPLSIPRPSLQGKTYTVRPAGLKGFGVYEVGSSLLLQRHSSEEDAWDAINSGGIDLASAS